MYRILNTLNGKCYVGQTKHCNLNRRWSASLSNSPNPHLSASVAKYGADAFRRDILAQTLDQEEADLLERYFICIWQTTDARYGYNLMQGGKQGPGRHLEEAKESIRAQMKTIWAKRDRWEFRLAQKLLWLSRTEQQREQIARKVARALQGKPSARKGRRFGPQEHPCRSWPPKSEEHRQHLSEALRMHFANQKKPSMGTNGVKGRRTKEVATNARETRLPVALREARRQLKEIQKRLDRLEQEYSGGCTW